MREFEHWNKEIDSMASGVDCWEQIKTRAYPEKKQAYIRLGNIQLRRMAAACLMLVLMLGIGSMPIRLYASPLSAEPGVAHPSVGDQLTTNAAGKESSDTETIVRPKGYPENIQDELAYDIDPYPMSQTFRVVMSYYDEAVVDSVKVDGVTMADICQNYLEWDLKERELPIAVFESLGANPEDPYGFFQQRYPLLMKNLPEIVGTEKLFFAYAYDPALQEKYPEAKKIVAYQKGYPDTIPVQIFGQKKVYPYESHKLDNQVNQRYESIKADYAPVVAKVGQRVNQSLVESCVKRYGLKDITYDPFTSRYSNRFTTTLSKRRILELASGNENLIFWEIGVDERPEGYNDAVSTAMAVKLDSMKADEKIKFYVMYKDSQIYNYDMFNDGLMASQAKVLKKELEKKYGKSNGGHSEPCQLDEYYLDYLAKRLKGYEEKYKYLRVIFPGTFTCYQAYAKELTKDEAIKFSQQPGIAYMDCYKINRPNVNDLHLN